MLWRGGGGERLGEGLGSAHCQLKHLTYTTVAGSKTLSQITTAAAQLRARGSAASHSNADVSDVHSVNVCFPLNPKSPFSK